VGRLAVELELPPPLAAAAAAVEELLLDEQAARPRAAATAHVAAPSAKYGLLRDMGILLGVL